MRHATVFLLSSFIACAGLGRTMAAAETFKVAAVEFNPVLKQREVNFPALEAAVRRAAGNDAKLVLFPEMSTPGYLYGSPRARTIGQDRQGMRLTAWERML